MSVYSRWMRPLISKEEAGFTLLEVMIAVVILAVGLLALATMQITAVRDNSGSYFVTDGKNWATDRFETILTDSRGYFNNPDLTPGDHVGLNLPPGYSIEWHVDEDDIITTTKTITMTIRATRFGLPKRVQLEYVM